jgi:hypothetical protein
MRTTGLAVASVLALVCTAAAQKPSGPQGESYATIPKLPDWSGAWVWPFHEFEAEGIQQLKGLNRPRLRAEYEQLRAAAMKRVTGAAAASATPSSPVCLPGRIPYVMGFSFAIEFLPSPGRVTMLLEQGSVIRRIYTDGRPLNPDGEPSWAGESIGHWENDTLVLRTTNIKPRPEQRGALMTSEKAVITERIRLRDKDHLQIDEVVEDPVTLLEPWRITRIYERTAPVFYDRVCDNNRDGNDEEPNLTPPN